jgi:hypothetical protein
MSIARLAIFLLACPVLLSVQAASDARINYINMFIRVDDEPKYGLAKLSPAERDRLNDEVFGSIVRRLDDNLRNSALAYLRQGGWVELEVIGTETLALDQQLGTRRYVVGVRAGSRLTLEPKSVSTLLPGTYLSLTDSSSCTVLDPQGRPVEFWVRVASPAREE